ncbi:MAG: T9SS type A sorting domain-containing protein, partial [Bacteroidales bacterium]|nr:T9SS type A sorting domain-containing protein [Bacteroidales bacterium]
GESSGVVRIFKNVGTVDTATYNIESFTADAFLLYENITNLDFVDLDDDGKKDLILGKYNDDDLSDGADAFRIYRNTSTQNEIGFTRLTGSENILDTMYAGLGNFAFVNLFGESEKSILINERDGENYDRFRYYTLYDLFSAFEGSTYTIAEDAIVGDVVGAINYTYRGSGTISKTITAGNTGNAFSISGNNIVVQTPDVIDYDIETNRTFNLTIEISDGTHSVNATYVINVSDVQTNVETLENDFRIYPNPIVDKLNIDIGDSFGNKVRLSLINNLGVVVYKQEALANTTATIYTSELEAGFYFVEIKSDTKTIIQKIIIK